MRPLGLIITALAVASPLAAQTTRASWHLEARGSALHFSHLARTPSDFEGELVTLRPSSRLGLAIGISRRSGDWAFGLEFGYASGSTRGDIGPIEVTDRTSGLTRYRIAPTIERHVARVSAVELVAGIAPALEIWDVIGETRSRVGAEARLALVIPLGPVALRNFVAAGVVGNPVIDEDLAPGERPGLLRWLSVGAGLAVGL